MTVLLIPLPKTGRAVDALLDCAHAPAFAFFSYLLFRLFPARSPRQFRFRITLILAIAAILGLATELAQQLTGRTASLQDAAADLLGAAAGVVWCRSSASSRRFWRLIAVMLIATACALPTSVLVDVIRQRHEMPLLASYEDSLEMTRWSRQDCEWARVPAHSTDGRLALHVELEPATYPGITLRHPVADWSGHDALTFDVFVEGDTPLSLVLKIEDVRHNGNVRDRYNGRLILAPGATSVRIPLSEIAAAPHERALNLMEIAKLQLYAVHLTQSTTFYVDNVRLE